MGFCIDKNNMNRRGGILVNGKFNLCSCLLDEWGKADNGAQKGKKD